MMTRYFTTPRLRRIGAENGESTRLVVLPPLVSAATFAFAAFNTLTAFIATSAEAAAHAERLAAAEVAMKAVNVLKAAKAKVAAETKGGSATRRVASPFSAPIRRKRGVVK